MLHPNLINNIQGLQTPLYYYNLELLEETLVQLTAASKKYNYRVHYALKANNDVRVLDLIRSYGLGADCVSGYEVQHAINNGFAANEIVFAGVGKSDAEIITALDAGIFSFNVESLQELQVIEQLASERNKQANIALRLNPDIAANTHAHITTGTKANKFGIRIEELLPALRQIKESAWLNFVGIHFHIGSQITTEQPFVELCNKVNSVQEMISETGMFCEHLNMGGGLGIDYQNPEENPVPNFELFFSIIHKHLKVRVGQKVHFELGRSVVAQCGALITKVLYVKNYTDKNFAVTDAGMTELIRPALYGAYHKVVNLSSCNAESPYDVVGPICESSDTLAKDCMLAEVSRGNLLAVYSSGAYGEVMTSAYNLRPKAQVVYSDQLATAQNKVQLKKAV